MIVVVIVVVNFVFVVVVVAVPSLLFLVSISLQTFGLQAHKQRTQPSTSKRQKYYKTDLMAVH